MERINFGHDPKNPPQPKPTLDQLLVHAEAAPNPATLWYALLAITTRAGIRQRPRIEGQGVYVGEVRLVKGEPGKPDIWAAYISNKRCKSLRSALVEAFTLAA